MHYTHCTYAQFTCTLIFVVCTNAGENSTSSILSEKNIRFTSHDDDRYLPAEQLNLGQVPKTFAQETEFYPLPPLFDIGPDAYKNLRPDVRPLKLEAFELAVSIPCAEPRACKLWFLMETQSGQPRAPLNRCLDCESLLRNLINVFVCSLKCWYVYW